MAPHFSDPDGTQGVWGGQKFQNVIRDGSAEQDNLRFQPWAQDKLGKLSVSFFDIPFTCPPFWIVMASAGIIVKLFQVYLEHFGRASPQTEQTELQLLQRQAID